MLAGAGTQTSGLAFGGETTVVLANTEEYDGSSWTAGGNLNTARTGLGGAGTQTTGLAFGGTAANFQPVTEEYNGASWTNSVNMNTLRAYIGGTGSQTSALAFGGFETVAATGATEEYTGGGVSVTRTVTAT
jgi:hypothetical protein